MSLKSCRFTKILYIFSVPFRIYVSAMRIKIFGYKSDFNVLSFSSAFFSSIFCVNVSKHFRGNLISQFFLSHEYRENKLLAKKC